MDPTYNVAGAPAPTMKRTADLGGPDFYPTPAWATHALCEVESFTGTIWEPACGDGAMAEVLRARGHVVEASDLYDRGYGEPGVDFMTAERRVANVVTNPPYNSAEGFIAAALRQAESKVAFLLRLAFLEGASRGAGLFKTNPPSRVHVFSERVTFAPAGVTLSNGGTTAYAWFIWDREAEGPTVLSWIPTGLRKRFSAPDPLPLFNPNTGAETPVSGFAMAPQ